MSQAGIIGFNPSTGTVLSLTTDDGHVVTPLGGTINLHGTHGLNTTGTVGPNTATIAINNAITLGDLVALGAGVGALTAITGDIIVTAGNIDMPATNSAGTAGVYEVGGFTFMHSGGPFNGAVGPDNVFLGGSAGAVGTISSFNVGIGRQALQNSGSDSNVAVGTFSCADLVGGSGLNTALGDSSLFALQTGTNNIAIGNDAGMTFNGAESNNIDIGNVGVLGESGVIRIGTDPVQTECFIAGIRGVTTVNNDAVAVLIDSAGQLGTVSSSMRYKTHIEPMEDSFSGRLLKLEPVTFSWKNEPDGKPQMGLLAEEVELAFPELVVYDKEGLPDTVKYHELPVLLLNELKKAFHRIEVLEEKLNS